MCASTLHAEPSDSLLWFPTKRSGLNSSSQAMSLPHISFVESPEDSGDGQRNPCVWFIFPRHCPEPQVPQAVLLLTDAKPSQRPQDHGVVGSEPDQRERVERRNQVREPERIRKACPEIGGPPVWITVRLEESACKELGGRPSNFGPSVRRVRREGPQHHPGNQMGEGLRLVRLYCSRAERLWVQTPTHGPHWKGPAPVVLATGSEPTKAPFDSRVF